MKGSRLITIMLAIILIVSTSAVGAGAKKKAPKRSERVLSETYDTPGIVTPIGMGGGLCSGPRTGCTRFESSSTERYVGVHVDDLSGQDVAFAVRTNWGGDGATEEHIGFGCGSTDEPFEIEPGVRVYVWVYNYSCIGVATTGTVTVTLSNLP